MGCQLGSFPFRKFQCTVIQSYTLYGHTDVYSDIHCTCGCLAAVRCCYCDGSLTSSPCCYSTILVYCGNSFVIAAPCHIFISCICRFYGCCQFFTAALNQYNFCFVQTHACHTHANLSTASLLLDITIAANCHIGICLQCIHSAVDCQRCIGCCYLHICYIGIHGHRFFCFYHNFFQSCGTASVFIFQQCAVSFNNDTAFEFISCIFIKFQSNLFAACFLNIDITADGAVFKYNGIIPAAVHINITGDVHICQCCGAVSYFFINIQMTQYSHIFQIHAVCRHCHIAVCATGTAFCHSNAFPSAGCPPIIIVIRIIRFVCIILCFHRIGTDTAGNAADINGHGVDVAAAFDGNFIFYGHIFHFPLGKVDGSLIGVFGDFHIFDSGVRTQFQVCFRIQCQIPHLCVDGDGTRQLFIHDNVCIIAAGKFADFLKCGFFHGGLAAGFHCGILLIHHHFFDVTIFQNDFTAAIYDEFAFYRHIFQCDGLCAKTVRNGQVTSDGGIFQFRLGQKHIFFFGFFFIFFLVAGLVVHGLIQCQNSFGSCQNTVRSKGAIGIACHDACFADSAHHAFCPIGNGVGICVAVCPAFILFQIQNTGNHGCRFLSGDRVIWTENAVAVTGNIACCHTSLDGIFTPVMAGYVGEISVAALCVAHGVIHQHHKFRSGNHVVRAESPVRIAADVPFIHPFVDGILCPVPLNICGRTESGDAHSHRSRQHSCNGNRMFLLHKLHPHINEKLFMEFLSSSNATVLCFSLRNNCFPPFVRKP